jgi:hypothetical protein
VRQDKANFGIGTLAAKVIEHRARLSPAETRRELDQMKDESLGYFDPRPWHRNNP